MVVGDGTGGVAWETLEEKNVFSCPVFDVMERRSRGPHGKTGTFSVIRAPEWAVVVPMVHTPEGQKFLMVRQYRHGADKSSLEFPGGVVEEGEDPMVAAERELGEETGWSPGRLVHAGTVSPNPALQGNGYHVFLALDCKPGKDRNLDEHEVVDALLVDAAEVRSRIGTGEYLHALMITALFLADRALDALAQEGGWD